MGFAKLQTFCGLEILEKGALQTVGLPLEGWLEKFS
jgi:hypothetical protein